MRTGRFKPQEAEEGKPSKPRLVHMGLESTMAQRVLVVSVRPRWVTEIVSGRKTVELRRRPPRLDQPVVSLIYETSPGCRLRAKCLMGPIVTNTPRSLWLQLGDRSGVTINEYDAYFAGTLKAYAIEIQRVEEMPAHLSLEYLRQKANFVVPQSWSWATPRLLEALGMCQ